MPEPTTAATIFCVRCNNNVVPCQSCAPLPATAHVIEWVQMWRCSCGTVGSTQTQADTHRRLHRD